MRIKTLYPKLLSIAILLSVIVTITVQCRLFGPEPGEPVYPAPIDPGDSAAVRAILDSNNLKEIGVRQVINKYTKGRIAFLYFDSLRMDSFSFTHDLERLDSIGLISLSNNKITQINVIDSLKLNYSCAIDVKSNSLISFPIGLLKISGVTNISVQYNKITSLPPELIHTGIPNVYIDHNKLCSLTDTNIVAWLDSTYGNWKSRQDCP